MSRPIGALYHVPHGLSNAMLAPLVTGFSVGGEISKYAQVSRMLGGVESGTSDEDAADKLQGLLISLNKELKVPSMKEWGINEEQFRKSVPLMAKAALDSGSPGNNPIIPTQQQIEQLYHDIWDSN